MTLTTSRPPDSDLEEFRDRRHPDEQHHWPFRFLVGLNVFLALCLLLTGAGFTYLRWRLGQIKTVHIGEDVGGISALAPEPPPGAPFNMLLVGSDTRQLDAADQKRYGRTTGKDGTAGARSDTIMVLRVDPKAEKAAILSIPRDLCIDGYCRSSGVRINSAFNDSKDGPASLIRTVTQVFGLPINHFAQVNFPGFRNIVNAIGGVTVYFAAPARDPNTGLDIPEAGCVSLSGEQSLQYVRSRHYEYRESGRWRTDPLSDFGRIARQQDFVRRVIRKSISSGTLTNPVALNALIGAAVESLVIDDQLSVKDMKTLALRFKSLTPDKVQTLTVATTETNVGGADVLKLDVAGTNAVLAEFGTEPLPGTQPSGTARSPGGLSPAAVSVRIQNGTGIDGQGAEIQRQLSGLGFNVASIGDANSFDYKRTTIRYGRNQLDQARLLQASLVNGANLVADAAVKGADVELVVGTDFSGTHPPASGSASTSRSSSTAPPAALSPTSGPQPKGTDPSVPC